MSQRIIPIALTLVLAMTLAFGAACDRGAAAQNEAWASACSSFCDRQIECEWTEDEKDVCVETCAQDIADVAESDGDECAQLEVDINACLGDSRCEQLETLENCQDLIDEFDEKC